MCVYVCVSVSVCVCVCARGVCDMLLNLITIHPLSINFKSSDKFL